MGTRNSKKSRCDGDNCDAFTDMSEDRTSKGSSRKLKVPWRGKCDRYSNSNHSTDDRKSDGPNESGAVLLDTGHSDAIMRVQGSSPLTGSYITGSEDRSIVLHFYGESSPRQVWRGHRRSISSLACFHRSAALFSGSRDLSICQWSHGKDEPVQTFSDAHELTVTGLALSHDDLLLLSGSRDNSLKVWDVDAGVAVSTVKRARNIVTCMKFVPDTGGSGGGRALFAQGSEDLSLRLWDARGGAGGSALKEVQSMRGYVYFPLCVDVDESGWYILTGSKGFNSVGCEGKLWDRRTGKVVKEFIGHRQDVVGCAFVHGSDSTPPLLVTASKDAVIRVWNRDTGECLSERIEDTEHLFTDLCAIADSAAEEHVSGSRQVVVVTAFSGAVFIYAIDLASGALALLQSSV